MRRTFVIPTLSLLALSISLALAQDRGVFVTPAPGESSPVKPAWLYVIGINQYRGGDIQKLQTPVADAKALRDLLLEKFQFDHSRLVERYDREATRERILNDLYELARKLGKDDSLFIYYAGHGIEDKVLGQGFWVPVDGKAGNIATMISNGDIRMALAGIPARHIWLVSDSCFSGSLLADRAIPDRIDDRYYREKYKLPSRMILTSGGKEPVADQSGARDCRSHSVFACYFLKSLRGSAQPYLTPNEVFTAVGRNVSNNSDQTPTLGALKQAGDEGGEFVLIARAGLLQAAPQPPPAPVTPLPSGPAQLAPLAVPSGGGASTNRKMLNDYGDVVEFEQGQAGPAGKAKRWLAFAQKWNSEKDYARQARERGGQWQVIAEAHTRADGEWAEVRGTAKRKSIPVQERYNDVASLLNNAPQDWAHRSEVQALLQQLQEELKKPMEETRVATLESSPSSGDTWRDPESSLTWQVTPPGKSMNWSEAKSYCSNLSLGGYSDWRLPSIGELRTLIRGCSATRAGGSCNIGESHLSWSGRSGSCGGCSGKGGPGVDGMYWPRELKGQCCWYWSSSPVADYHNRAWHVYFNLGNVYNYDVNFDTNVRCVR